MWDLVFVGQLVDQLLLLQTLLIFFTQLPLQHFHLLLQKVHAAVLRHITSFEFGVTFVAGDFFFWALLIMPFPLFLEKRKYTVFACIL